MAPTRELAVQINQQVGDVDEHSEPVGSQLRPLSINEPHRGAELASLPSSFSQAFNLIPGGQLHTLNPCRQQYSRGQSA